ncbi:mucin-associated surface protein (MASP), putative, partial [Trypanosoma cruzi marinkellei]
MLCALPLLGYCHLWSVTLIAVYGVAGVSPFFFSTCVDGELVCAEGCTQVTGVMAMMMTGRVLLVCVLCVLWCGIAGGIHAKTLDSNGVGGCMLPGRLGKKAMCLPSGCNISAPTLPLRSSLPVYAIQAEEIEQNSASEENMSTVTPDSGDTQADSVPIPDSGADPDSAGPAGNPGSITSPGGTVAGPAGAGGESQNSRSDGDCLTPSGNGTTTTGSLPSHEGGESSQEVLPPRETGSQHPPSPEEQPTVTYNTETQKHNSSSAGSQSLDNDATEDDIEDSLEEQTKKDD